MKKKILAFFTMAALLTCVLAVVMPADAASTRYQVGYAIKDVNPYIYSGNLGFGVPDLGDLATDADWTVEVSVQNPSTKATTTERMIRVPLSGYANSADRPSSEIMDDNNDGYTGIGDGLHITCTTVTDSQGNTLIYFTVDAISGYSGLLTDATKGVIAELGSTVSADRVFLNGSHSHESADFGSIKKSITETSSNRDRLWRAYYDYTVQQMVDAAVESYNNRTEAVMTKGSVDASVSSGYQLNYIRHYKVDEYPAVGSGYSSTPSSTYLFGSNFGSSKLPTETSTLKRTVNTIHTADDQMHILQFTPTNGDAPIVLLNWRCHATMMSNYTGGGTGAVISADYIAALRYQMQKAGYRFAFLQGAGGNVVANHALSALSVKNGVATVGRAGYTPWLDDMPAGTANHAIYYGGTMLKNVAMDCLGNYMTGELEAGPIRSIKSNLDLKMQIDPPGLVAACTYYQEQGLTSSNYKYTWPVAEGGDGKVYIINSKHHARNVVNRSKSNAETYADMRVNAFTLGKYVTFVTAPTEMFDRYSDSPNTTLTNTTDNDWNDLINKATYGTPFVMAYTNGHNGYTANKLSYSYNIGSSSYGIGSYEANSSRNAAGEGEKIIDEYQRLIGIITDGYKKQFCQHCQQTVTWKPLVEEELVADTHLYTGHYYLYEDVPLGTVRNTISVEGEVCFDMNGHTYNALSRGFIVTGDADNNNVATLSLMDSSPEGSGAVISYNASNAVGGGVISMGGKNAKLNLYGGTLKMDTDPEKGYTPYEGLTSFVAKGGVINCTGTINIYGGCIDASDCQMAPDVNNNITGTDHDGCGAAICLTSGRLNVYGGKIIGGKAEPTTGKGDCVYAQGTSSKITLSGDAQVDEIYFYTTPALTVDGDYTGSVTLQFGSGITVKEGLDIGNLTNNGSIVNANMTCTSEGYYVTTAGTDLLLTEGAACVVNGERLNYYASAQAAINAAGGKLVRLRKGVTSALSVSRDTYLDLNSYSVTGKVTVASGSTLYGMDTATADYTVADGKYGKLTNVQGNVVGIPEAYQWVEDGYLMVDENGALSFHRVNLNLFAMTLRATDADTGVCEPSVYYKSYFKGDEIVAQKVQKYGVALSVQAVPDAQNLDTLCKYSAFDTSLDGIEFKPGTAGNQNNGTLLKGIMKETNLPLMNSRNANMAVYGRAYILTEDGYMFGASVNRTLKEQTQLTDDIWSSLTEAQKASLVTMYNTYSAVMKNWDIPNIIAAAQA